MKIMTKFTLFWLVYYFYIILLYITGYISTERDFWISQFASKKKQKNFTNDFACFSFWRTSILKIFQIWN